MYCNSRSPIITAVCKALDESVWDKISENVSPDVKSEHARHFPHYWWVEHIKKQKENGPGATWKPEEYWLLLADLLYHLPVVRGLPDLQKNKRVILSSVPYMTANALRLRVRSPRVR